MKFITVTLNPCIDKTYVMPDALTPGKLNRPISVTVSPGGKGINAARALFRLVEEPSNKSARALVYPVFFAGGNNGKLLVESLKKTEMAAYEEHGVLNTVIPLPEGEETRTCVKIKDQNGRITELNEPGAHIDEHSLELLFGAITDLVQSDEKTVALMCGSIPQGVEKNVYNLLIFMLKSCGAITVLDASGEPLREGLRGEPDLIKPNLEELSYLAGRPLDFETEAVEYAEQIFHNHGTEVLLTNGGKGAVFVGKCGTVFGETDSLSTGAVGSGDAFLAAFCSAYYSTLSTCSLEDAEKAMRLACSAGYATALAYGKSGRTAIPDRDKLVEYREKVRIRVKSEE